MKQLLTILLLSLGMSTAYAEGGCGVYKEDTGKVERSKDEQGKTVETKVEVEKAYACAEAPINLTDKASLQRGAAVFISYCAGCHSAKFVRYQRLADDLNMPPEIVQQYMNFTSDKVGNAITSNIDPKLQKNFFGNTPPDLSLETRFRSPDWVYTYLLSFYQDENRPWGVNNTVFKDVAMPDVLHSLKDDVGEAEYKAKVGDLVNFMTYMAEPVQHDRKVYGFFVILFLLALLIPVYLLNKEFWKDVK